MPRDSSGVYTLPPSNPVQTATPIQSTGWANPTMSDIGTEITNSLDRAGRGGMTGPFGITDGTLAAPGLRFTADPANGLRRTTTNTWTLVASATDIAQVSAAGFAILVGGLSTAGITSTGNITINKATPELRLNKPAAGTFATLAGYTNNLPRWLTLLGDSAAESGSDVGSDFAISRYTDAGAFIDNPFFIKRSTGYARFLHRLGLGLSTDPISPLDVKTENSGPGITLRGNTTSDFARFRVTDDTGATVQLDWNFSADGSFQHLPLGILKWQVDGDGNMEFRGSTLVQNQQSVSYTAVASDANKHIYAAPGVGTLTIPANAAVPYAVGTALVFVAATGSPISIAINTDTLILAATATTGTRTLANNGIATAIKIGAGVWLISGTGLT